MTINVLKARLGSISPAVEAKIAEVSHAAYQLITAGLPRLIRIAELTAQHRKANAEGALGETYRLEAMIDRALEELG